MSNSAKLLNRNDKLTQALLKILPYAEAEADSLDAHGKNDERCRVEAEEAWKVIEAARLALSE